MLGYLDADTKKVLDIASVKTGINIVNKVVQGGHSTSVAASNGTHAGNGAADISANGLSDTQIAAIIAAIRIQGNATAWYRNWPGNRHIHVVVYTTGMASGTLAQWKQYLNGQNGMGQKDDSPRDQAALQRAISLSGVDAVNVSNSTQNVGMFSSLTDPNVWIRIAEVVLGIALILIALVRITGITSMSNVSSIAKVVKNVG